MIFDGAYKKILDRIPEGVFVFDNKLRIRYTNTAFRRSFSENVKKGPMQTDFEKSGAKVIYAKVHRFKHPLKYIKLFPYHYYI